MTKYKTVPNAQPTTSALNVQMIRNLCLVEESVFSVMLMSVNLVRLMESVLFVQVAKFLILLAVLVIHVLPIVRVVLIIMCVTFAVLGIKKLVLLV